MVIAIGSSARTVGGAEGEALTGCESSPRSAQPLTMVICARKNWFERAAKGNPVSGHVLLLLLFLWVWGPCLVVYRADSWHHVQGSVKGL